MTLFPNKLFFCGTEGLGLQPMNRGRGGYNLNCNSILPVLEVTLKYFQNLQQSILSKNLVA